MADNLASLGNLDETILLQNVHQRYQRDIIYTYVGDLLIAVNPYKKLPIYSTEMEERYSELANRSSHSPHVYAVSDNAYQSVRRTGKRQCCVVSGESGAGKTETTKFLVEHIAHLSQHIQTKSRLHDRIIQVNPLLEAFGNAQTLMNQNSSRFGKFIELMFSSGGNLVGGRISEYLLEKSRVVSQGPGERNFHIFYYLFAGLTAEQKQANLLRRPETHRILRPADGRPVFSSDAELRYCQSTWNSLQNVLATVGFQSQDVNTMLALLAAILHITDIRFERDADTDGVFIADEQILELASVLLAVPPETFASALISNALTLRGEMISSLKSESQAIDGRDALAKSLYSRLFGWIVRQVNYMLVPDLRKGDVVTSIGILDIAGFENFHKNSFEQLCINVTNEQLQFYFNQQIFQWEIDECKKEGIRYKELKFSDNRPLIDLFVATPLGLFSILDEESRFPQATDETLLEKLCHNLGKRPAFIAAKGNNPVFTINHYAGPVTYMVHGFLEKNRDTLSPGLTDCMMNSESQIVCDLFSAHLSDTGALVKNPNMPQRSKNSVLLCKPITYTTNKSLSKSLGKKVMQERAREQQNMQIMTNKTLNGSSATLGRAFKNSLTELMAKLLDSEPQFVRCLKPNVEKQPSMFVPDLVMDQLRYTGILETIRIRRQGFATRLKFSEFVDGYKFLAFSLLARNVEGSKENCIKILKKCQLKDYEIGKTKIFLRYWQSEHLNGLIDHFHRKIVICQKLIRGFLTRRRLRGMKKTAQHDQMAIRGLGVYISQNADNMYNKMIIYADDDNKRYATTLESFEDERLRERRQRQKQNKEATYIKTFMVDNQNPYGDFKSVQNGLKESSNSGNFMFTDNTSTQSPIEAANTWVDKQLEETFIRFPKMQKNVWGKIIIMDKKYFLCGKVHLSNKEIIIDNSTNPFDGNIIGLFSEHFPNENRDRVTNDILKRIGKGVKLIYDSNENIYIKKLSKQIIQIKEHSNIDTNCFSDDVARLETGKIKDKKVCIFDMDKFRRLVMAEMMKSELSISKIRRLTTVRFAFERNTFDCSETPCWSCLISISALDALGKEAEFDSFVRASNMQLSEADRIQLKNRWRQLSIGERMERERGRPPTLDFHKTYLPGTVVGPSRNERDKSPTYADSIVFTTTQAQGYSSNALMQGMTYNGNPDYNF